MGAAAAQEQATPAATSPAPAHPHTVHHHKVRHREVHAHAHVPVVAPSHHHTEVRHTETRHAEVRHAESEHREAELKEPAARKATLHKEPAHKVAVVARPVPRKPAPPPVPADVGTVTGLHLPRFASLKSGDINMRVGPAERYPVTWVYKRRELPVKIEREFDVWRLVEDMDGVKGWVHQATLTGRRTFVITGTENRTMRADSSPTATPVAVLKPGVVGVIRSCAAGNEWCQVQVGDYRGWLQRSDFWGTQPGEAVGQ